MCLIEKSIFDCILFPCRWKYVKRAYYKIASRNGTSVAVAIWWALFLIVSWMDYILIILFRHLFSSICLLSSWQQHVADFFIYLFCVQPVPFTLKKDINCNLCWLCFRLERDLRNDKSGQYSHLVGTPKPLLPVGGIPLITHWIRAFDQVPKITSVVVVVNDLHKPQWVVDN